ncbi:MAG: carbohydrate kinase family protein [Halodesulfurarchaeum sp.]
MDRVADRTPEIVTVGSAVLDRVYSLSNLPEPDGGAFVRDYEERGGGVAANVACGLSALDHDVAIISRVGADEAAGTILESLREWDVDVSTVRRGDVASSYTLVLHGPDGGRMIVAGGESVPHLRIRPGDRDHLESAACVFTSAYAPEAVTAELVEMRRRGEIDCLAFDLPGPLAELEGRGTTPGTIDGAAAVADLFVSNRVAVDSYLGADPESAVERLADAGAARLAVTTGADGAYLEKRGSEPIHVPAEERSIVDTTGAGDQFTAALIHAWVLGRASPPEAGRIAAIAAAQNCTARGPRGSLASREDLPTGKG